jgi:hypothetical protein
MTMMQDRAAGTRGAEVVAAAEQVLPVHAGRPRRNRGYDRVQHLSDLLARRPDLHGVYKPADVAAEAVRWSV